MFLGDMIKKYREENNLSLRAFAQKCNLSYTYISMLEKNCDYRTGKPIAPTLDSVKNIANAMNMPIDDLLKVLDDEQEFVVNNISKEKQYYMCPVYGRISAGQPNWAEEYIEGRIPIDIDMMNIINPEEYFFLKVNGESMNKIIKNGAFALIHKQDIVDNGDVAVILVDEQEATLKIFNKQDNVIVLSPNSSENEFKQQIYTQANNIKVLGKYVGKMEFNN